MKLMEDEDFTPEKQNTVKPATIQNMLAFWL